jgi:hypothetical protein
MDQLANPTMCAACYRQGREMPSREQVESPTPAAASTPVPKRYPALRALAGICRLLAWMVGIAAVLAILAGVSALERGGILWVLAGLVGGPVAVVSTLAIADFIRLMIDIEDHTRTTGVLNPHRDP